MRNWWQGRNRTTDTRIFSRELGRLGLYISKSYRGVRCPIRSTVQDCAQLIHAKLTHWSERKAQGWRRVMTLPVVIDDRAVQNCT